MNLCSLCVVEVISNPYAFDIEGLEDRTVPRAHWGALIESYATDEPERPRILTRDSERRVITLRAVSVVEGIPLCVWHTATRSYQVANNGRRY